MSRWWCGEVGRWLVVCGGGGGEVKVVLMVIFFPFFPSYGLHTEGGDLAVGLHELFLIEKSLEIAALGSWAA